MAVWQFQIQIVPKKEVEKKYQPIPEIIGVTEIEKLEGWSRNSSLDKAMKLLSDFLHPKQGWMNDVKQWGEEESDCVEILFENNHVSEIIFRIDLQNLKREMLNLVIEFSIELDGLILIENRLYKPILRDIVIEIKKSNASKFVDNSEKFLKELDDE